MANTAAKQEYTVGKRAAQQTFHSAGRGPLATHAASAADRRCRPPHGNHTPRNDVPFHLVAEPGFDQTLLCLQACFMKQGAKAKAERDTPFDGCLSLAGFVMFQHETAFYQAKANRNAKKITLIMSRTF